MSGGIEVLDVGLAGQIAELEKAKKTAMLNEDFERCAAIRDQINTLRKQMATGAGSSNQGTSATRGSAPDSDESNEYQSEWDMDEARGLRPDPTGGGRRAFDPNRAPPPESLDPDYGRRDIGGDGEARLRRRAAGLSERQAARAENGAGKNSGAATHRCDWDTVFIVVLACVLFSFLVLDVYAQIKMHSDKLEVHGEHEEL